MFSDTHILSTILFTPLFGAAVVALLPQRLAHVRRWVASVAGLLGIFVSLPLLWRFREGDLHQFQFVQDLPWMPSLGARYTVGIDGISVLMIMLTVLMAAIAICSSWAGATKREREYYALLLVLETGALGVFMSLDMVLFYFFWSIVLIPMYILIGVWGSERRLQASMKMLLYSLVGSVVMLFAILAVFTSAHTFSMQSILESPAPLFSLRVQKWLFWGFFVAFAIRTPMFPFHSWLIDAQEQAPAAVSAMLAGVFVQMGTYGFLRFSLPMFPEASMRYRTPMIWLSLIAIVYCALICLMEKNLKRLLAYFSVAYLGFCTLGIFASTQLGLKGSLIQQLNHGISFGALLLIAGMLYARRKTARISDFGGLAKPIPNLAGAFFIFILSVIGIPLLNGFVGEFAILRGAFDVRWQWAAWATIGLILGAAAMIWLYQRVMLGRTTNYLNENLPDLRWHEYATLTPLLALAFWIGIYPAPIFRVLNQPVQEIVERYNPAFYAPQNATDTQSPRQLAPGATVSAKNISADTAERNK